MSEIITPIQIDFSNIREERQKINNNHVYDIIKAKNWIFFLNVCFLVESFSFA